MNIAASSLPSDGIVLGDGDVGADAAECTYRVVELLRRVDAFTQGQRVRVVEEIDLVLPSLALVDSAHAWVLLVEPRALHVGLLLRVVGLRVHLAHQVRDLLDALLLCRAQVASSQSLLRSIECCSRLSWALLDSLTEVVPVLCAEVTGVVAGDVARDHGAKARLRRVYGSVH